VSSDAVTLRRGTCGPLLLLLLLLLHYAIFTDSLQLILKIRHGAIVDIIHIDLYAKFNDDRLGNEKALVR